MLTDAKIRNAKPADRAYKIKDAHGLRIEIRPTGGKFWRYRYRIGGAENTFALGTYPEVSLTEARALRDEARKLVKQGIHPAHKRRSTVHAQINENANTFSSIADEWFKEKSGKWSKVTVDMTTMYLTRDINPVIGSLPIKDITPAQLLSVVKRSKQCPANADKIRGVLRRVFRYAMATLKIEQDPTSVLIGSVDRAKTKHHPHVLAEDLAVLLKKIDAYDSPRHVHTMKRIRPALHLIVLLFSRKTELGAAKKDEFDLDNANGPIWRVPAERMKMREAHVVPLPRQAVGYVRELMSAFPDSPYLLPHLWDHTKPMSPPSWNNALNRFGFKGKLSPHGLRGTFSTIINEGIRGSDGKVKHYREDVIERQLAHKPKNAVRASYNHAQYLDERREMMQDWADYLDYLKSGSKVIQLRRSA